MWALICCAHLSIKGWEEVSFHRKILIWKIKVYQYQKPNQKKSGAGEGGGGWCSGLHRQHQENAVEADGMECHCNYFNVQ